jgi:L-rhamnose mutarotase
MHLLPVASAGLAVLACLALAACSTAPRPAASNAVTSMAKPAVPPSATLLPAVTPVHGPSNPVATPATSPGVKFYASIVGLDPAREKLYRELHANVWPEVVAAIRRANITNYNIYVTEIEGRRYLVSTFEYVGTDPDRDFGSIALDPVTRDKWWPLTDNCQIRLPGTAAEVQWRPMEQVMHLP